MNQDRTELEWNYEPTDFFEAPYQYAETDFELEIDSGRAKATLTAPTPSDREAHVRSVVKSLFLIRQLQVHRNYTLEGPTISMYSAGHKNVVVEVGSAIMTLTSGSVDFIIQDPAGNVVRDSKAERIAEDTSLLNLLAPKLQLSATLRNLMASYSKAVADPADEFLHLYEIRDAISHYYGSEHAARQALGIGENKWKRLGLLANVEPLEQSRHRGKHSQGHRPATSQELEEARKLVREWIIAFALTV
jgi:hypothetical protein